MHTGISGQRYCREGLVDGEACACSLAPVSFTVDRTAAAFVCLPSFQNTKYFYMKYLGSLRLTGMLIVFADNVVTPTTCLHLRTENEDFNLSHTCICKGFSCTPDNILSGPD